MINREREMDTANIDFVRTLRYPDDDDDDVADNEHPITIYFLFKYLFGDVYLLTNLPNTHSMLRPITVCLSLCVTNCVSWIDFCLDLNLCFVFENVDRFWMTMGTAAWWRIYRDYSLRKGKYYCRSDLLFDWFGFNQTNNSVVNQTEAKQVNAGK